MAVQPIPDGSPRVVPYLTVEGADKAIEFYKNVLGATETVRMPGPDGNIGHAEMTIGDSLIMLADAAPDMNILGPKQVGGTPVTIMVYVEDVDATFARALSEGATETRPVENQFYGDRAGQFVDPFGHRWHVATHVEDVTPEQMQERMVQMFGSN